MKKIVLILVFTAGSNWLVRANYAPNVSSPKITIITSIYKSDRFIAGFLADITRQTIFSQCELVLINAASPGREEKSILPYLARYPNIIYKKLDCDPGLYAVWNIGIKMARGTYITNANVDDRLAPNCYEQHAAALDQCCDVSLVYSSFLLTKKLNETMAENTAHRRITRPEFSPDLLKNYCLPGPHPMWRKVIHDQYGFFDETLTIAGDYEMWVRLVSKGVKFKLVSGVNCLFYINPKGLSCNTRKFDKQIQERSMVRQRYSDFFLSNNEHF